MFSGDDPYIGVDLDHVWDPEKGEFRVDWARDMVEQLQGQAYMEFSPSGDGIHIIARGKMPEGMMNKHVFDDGTGIEVYDQGRYFTWTGRKFEGSTDDIVDLQYIVDWLFSEKFFGLQKSEQTTQPTAMLATADVAPRSDDQILKRMEGYLANCQPIAEGGRNSGVFGLAGHLFHGFGGSESDVMRLMLDFNRTKCDPPMDGEEVRAAVASSISNGTPPAKKPDQPLAPSLTAEEEAAFVEFGEHMKKFCIRNGEVVEIDQAAPPEGVESFEAPPSQGKLKFECADTTEVARDFVRENSIIEGNELVPTLRYWQGEWWQWAEGKYSHRDPDTMMNSAMMHWGDQYWGVTAGRASSTLRIAAGHSVVDCGAPAWVGEPPVDWPMSDCIFYKNVILNWKRNEFLPATAKLFTTNCSPVAYDFDSGDQPPRWLKFLDEIFKGDQASILSLQQVMGWLMTPSQKFHKIPFLVGPQRSGKSLILRVLTAIVGDDSVASKGLDEFAGGFALGELMSKSICQIPDARWDGRDQAIVLRNLLNISGGDSVRVERKYKDSVSMHIPTRLIMTSNVLPAFVDTDPAIVDRFLPIKTQASFLGREDHDLEEKLIPEYPAIVNWALAGVRSIQGGLYISPEGDLQKKIMLQELNNVEAWVRACCEIVPGHTTAKADAYANYYGWSHYDNQRQLSKRKFNASMEAIDGISRRSAAGGAETWVRYKEQRVRGFTGVKIVRRCSNRQQRELED